MLRSFEDKRDLSLKHACGRNLRSYESEKVNCGLDCTRTPTSKGRRNHRSTQSKNKHRPSCARCLSLKQSHQSSLGYLSAVCGIHKSNFTRIKGFGRGVLALSPLVSSSSFLAASYARVVVDFLLSNADHVKPSVKNNGRPNCFVWEAASGSCKFLHSFMSHFTDLVEDNDEFRRRGLVPLVVATDLSKQVLSSRRQMACFRPFIERGQLDFAIFDTHEFISGSSSKRRWSWYMQGDSGVSAVTVPLR